MFVYLVCVGNTYESHLIIYDGFLQSETCLQRALLLRTVKKYCSGTHHCCPIMRGHLDSPTTHCTLVVTPKELRKKVTTGYKHLGSTREKGSRKTVDTFFDYFLEPIKFTRIEKIIILSTEEEREHQQKQRRVKKARAQTKKADEHPKGVDVSRGCTDLPLATNSGHNLVAVTGYIPLAVLMRPLESYVLSASTCDQTWRKREKSARTAFLIVGD